MRNETSKQANSSLPSSTKAPWSANGPIMPGVFLSDSVHEPLSEVENLLQERFPQRACDMAHFYGARLGMFQCLELGIRWHPEEAI